MDTPQFIIGQVQFNNSWRGLYAVYLQKKLFTSFVESKQLENQKVENFFI